ncbi:MAG: dual specificity protein phosphatase family protein [Thaumarchaeota archaeon]|nr:dual specificity protein phosphatase family protein [Nitrososphaerota archaeon]
MGRVGRVYRKVRAQLTDKPTFFTWVRGGKISASGRPYSKSQVDWLKDHGVTAILSLTEDPLPRDWTTGIEYRHIALKDHEPIDLSKMREAADFIASSISDGKAVLVHCLAGKGRTGSVLAAYMIAYEGKTAHQAIEELRSRRPGSVERLQEPKVIEFERDVLQGSSSRSRTQETKG